MSLIGFSRLLGKSSQNFIPLDRDTTGARGRPLYIDSDLSKKFAGIDGGDLSNIMHKLKQLGATAGGQSAYSSMNDAMTHMSVIGVVRVSYKIFQNTNDPKYRAGVYITDVDLNSFADGEPGLRKVNFERNDWRLNRGEQPEKITSHYAAINGFCRDAEQAATKILPDLLKEAYKDKSYPERLESEGYNMFYNPPSLYTKGARFKTPKQKKVSLEHTAELLKNTLVNAQSNQKDVRWVVHSDGARLFSKALDKLNGTKLDNHTVLFLAPTEDVSALLPKMSRCNIKLHSDVMKINDDDWRSKSVQMTHGPQMQQALKNYPGLEDSDTKSQLFARAARKDLFAFTGDMLSSGTFGFGAGSFLMAPIAISTMGVAGLAGMAYGSYAVFKKAESVRNAAATNLKNPSLNPHMHPFKNSEQMSVHMQNQSGGVIKTFYDVLKGKVTG